eukprot:528529-Rhodomonas_salina.1
MHLDLLCHQVLHPKQAREEVVKCQQCAVKQKVVQLLEHVLQRAQRQVFDYIGQHERKHIGESATALIICPTIIYLPPKHRVEHRV